MQTLEEIFKYQIDAGATDVFCYGIYDEAAGQVEVKTHRGPLSTFPSTLDFVRESGGNAEGHPTIRLQSTPLFKIVS